MHLTFCELILKDSVGKGATQCTFDELINKRPGSIIRDVRVDRYEFAHEECNVLIVGITLR